MRSSMWWTVLLAALFVFGLAACDDSGNNDADGDQLADGDSLPDGDAESTDGDGENACTLPPLPEETLDTTRRKFALSMFHFNVQYVPGGLEVTENGTTTGMCGKSCLGWTDEKVQDWIITETFEPALDIYLRHPTWQVSFEMQALMIEAMAARHPEVLEKLKEGTHSGQIELVSFHYSDQFFLAFPERDLIVSQTMTKQIVDKSCLRLSGVVFNQEGQAGPGKHAFMKAAAAKGLPDYTISVFPKNLYDYVRYNETRWPLYNDQGVDVVIGPTEVDFQSGITVDWTFFDDGELLAVPADPYFAFTAKKSEKKLKEYEDKLTALEADGYKISSITSYVKHLRAIGIESKPLPAVIDGTWQPTSTDSVLRWMGGRSLAPYNTQERDNYIRTLNYTTELNLAAAEVLRDTAQASGKTLDNASARFDEAWRHLLLAEVSDATGITPWRGEFVYGRDNTLATQEGVESLIADYLSLLSWPHVEINLAERTATKLDVLPQAEAPVETTAPFEVTVSAPTRQTTLTWYEGPSGSKELAFTYNARAVEENGDPENTRVSLAFPRYEDKLIYSPALTEREVVSHDFSQFSFKRPEIYLTLSNGLIGLGNNWWLIKKVRHVHLAAKVGVTQENRTIEFIDETADPTEPQTWRFLVFQGSQDDALRLALDTNIEPVQRY